MKRSAQRLLLQEIHGAKMRAELKSPTSITRGSVTTTTRQLNRSRSSETAAAPHQFPQGHTHTNHADMFYAKAAAAAASFVLATSRALFTPQVTVNRMSCSTLQTAVTLTCFPEMTRLVFAKSMAIYACLKRTAACALYPQLLFLQQATNP